MTHAPERPKWQSWLSYSEGRAVEVVPLEDVKALLRALKYYANEDTWDGEGVAAHITKDPKQPMGEYLDYRVDYGSTARETLSQVPPEWLE